MKDNIGFRNRLIELRKRKGWSQEELGYKLGVSRQTVSKWETGESTPEITKLVKMSKLYNLTMEELIEGKDENKAVTIDAKVVSNNNTQVLPKVESPQVKEFPTLNMIEVRTQVKNNNFIKKHLRKIIIVIAALLLITYLGFSVYKFCILKEINDKFNEYKNVDNCYYERKEIVTNNEIGTAYIINERYWYKDGLLKVEEIRTENGVTQTIKKYVNLNEDEIYTMYENTKELVKRKNIYEYKNIKNGILQYTISENYYKNNIDIIKDSLNIFKNVSIQNSKYIKKSKNQNGNAKKIYNKENSFIEQSYTLNNNEEIKILYNIEIGIVKDEDVKIEFLDLTNYKIVER